MNEELSGAVGANEGKKWCENVMNTAGGILEGRTAEADDVAASDSERAGVCTY